MSSMSSSSPSEPLGQRIGVLRAQRGWTQADLAARLAVSRVAVSHFEMGLAAPSERTVVLLAGLFKMEPHELVAGTSYPVAKRERLPTVACRYTELELQLALLRQDLEWLERLGDGSPREAMVDDVLSRCANRLRTLRDVVDDRRERALVREADRALAVMASIWRRRAAERAEPAVRGSN